VDVKTPVAVGLALERGFARLPVDDEVDHLGVGRPHPEIDTASSPGLGTHGKAAAPRSDHHVTG
jgi:hypothetical protein